MDGLVSGLDNCAPLVKVWNTLQPPRAGGSFFWRRAATVSQSDICMSTLKPIRLLRAGVNRKGHLNGAEAVTRAVLLVLSLIVVAGMAAASQPMLVGIASVIDGDTIEIRGTRIRLFGIDAPEGGQTCFRANGAAWQCGEQSAIALTRQLGRSELRCEPRGQDRYRRTIAVCFKGAEDINQWMVTSGWAVAFRRYSLGGTSNYGVRAGV